ncbi:MAG: tetratricopeptide repeat protein [Bacteroidales bacterium]|nr:tetratricopeptide repeat protein [Bacteroidales bacterium]
MTVAEAQNLYTRIVDQVLHQQMREAFVNLSFLIQQNGYGLAYDKLSELENNYRMFLRFKLEGYEDPGRDKVFSDLRRHCLELADDAFRRWMNVRSPHLYYEQLRLHRDEALKEMDEPLVEMKQLLEKQALVDLVESGPSRQAQLRQLKKKREELLKGIFTHVWVSDRWTSQDLELYRKRMLESDLQVYERALLVSALFLGLLRHFDEHKLQLLLDLTEMEHPEIGERAWVASVLLLYVYDDRLPFFPSIGLKVDAMMEDPTRKQSLIRVYRQLARAKNTDQVTKRMQEEILPEMSRFGSAVQDRLSQEDSEEGGNPDWKEMIENSGFSEKMQAFSEMQLEGIDVYMSTFSGQKFYPFFQELSNWFLPFHKDHTSVNDLFEDSANDIAHILETVLQSGFLCASDKYSFCFNLMQIPSAYRASMASSMGAESDAYEEYKKAQSANNARFHSEQITNAYIQDLYRFFHLHPRKRDFINIFSFPLDLIETKLLGSYLNESETIRIMTEVYFKNKQYAPALRLLDRCLQEDPSDAELWQKKAFCLQESNQRSEALEAYLQADLIDPNSLWTLKRIATCLRTNQQPLKALDYYKRADALSPDNRGLILQMGHCMVEAGLYSDALQQYFKAEFLTEPTIKTWRPIAWCAMMCRKFELSESYYQKILAGKADMEDYLNAGHLEWAQSKPLSAIDRYRSGIRATHTPFPEFLDLFQRDTKSLIELGVDPSDIPFVRDELFYTLQDIK